MALADVLNGLRAEFSFRLELTHLNYELRPKANAETELVEHWARERGLVLRVQRVPLAGTAGNLQAQARAARWALARAWAAGGLQPAAVATGHTADDQVETMLLHLVRGSGLAGLAGMQALTLIGGLTVLRPLLTMPRKQVMRHIAARQLPYAMDSSNAADQYSRNRMRHAFAPAAESINTAYHDHFQQVATTAAAADRLLREQMGEVAARGRNATFISIDTATLKKYHQLQRFYWWQAALPQGVPLTTARFRVLERFLAIGAARWQEAGVAAEVWRGRLFVYDPAAVAVPAPAAVRLHGCERLREWNLTLESTALPAWPPALPDGAAVFAAAALRGPFLLRGRRPGDAFPPAGMGGQQQRLKEFLPGCGIPRFLRDRIPLLTDTGRDGNIIWVVGHRLAADAAGRYDGDDLRMVTVREGV